MEGQIKKIIKQCLTFKLNKYDRKPNIPEIKSTPIPQYPGQLVHTDIYIVEKKYVLTTVDKFSK